MWYSHIKYFSLVRMMRKKLNIEKKGQKTEGVNFK